MSHKDGTPSKRPAQVSMLDLCVFVLLSALVAFVFRLFEHASLPLVCGFAGALVAYMVMRTAAKPKSVVVANGYGLGFLFGVYAFPSAYPLRGWLFLATVSLGPIIWGLSEFALRRNRRKDD